MTNNLKRAIDTELSCLRVTQRESARIVENALEGRKVKRKISAAFVLAMVIALVSAAALAYSLSRQYFEDIAQMEGTHGFYEQWKMDDKLALLKLMKDNGVEMNTEEAEVILSGAGLSEHDREKRMDALIADAYGINGRTDVITLESILEKELGTMEIWTMEQKAWYSQMLMNCGLMGSDDDIFRMPGQEAILPEEAIAIAKREIMRVWGLAESDLAAHTAVWSYLTHSSDREEKLLHYEITFKPENGSEKTYYCSVGKDGRLLTSEDVIGASSPKEQKETDALMQNLVDQEARGLYQQYGKEHGLIRPAGEISLDWRDWPLADKQAFSELVRPIVIENMANNPNYADWSYAIYAERMYGMPEENALTQAQAEAIAYEALDTRLHLPGELRALCDYHYVFYIVTDPVHPIWKITYSANRHGDAVEAMGNRPGMAYLVTIDAHTGAVIDTLVYHPSERDGLTGLEIVERAF